MSTVIFLLSAPEGLELTRSGFHAVCLGIELSQVVRCLHPPWVTSFNLSTPLASGQSVKWPLPLGLAASPHLPVKSSY